MTHAANLIRFTLVASAIAFAFAFNLAAMYAQVVYVFLPGTRVTGAPAADWSFTESAGILHVIATNHWMLPTMAVAALIVSAVMYRHGDRKES